MSGARKSKGPKGAWWTRVDAASADVVHVPDAAIDALGSEERRALAAIWQKRGGLELRVGAAFAVIATELLEFGATPQVLAIVSRAVRDEVDHAEISVDLAARYRGNGGVVWPPPAPVHVPEFAPASPRLRVALHVIAMCCINETVACACLEAALSQAESPLVKAGLQSVLSDEVDHARAGWAYLASGFVSDEVRRELPEWILRLLKAKLRELVEEESPLPGEAYANQGMLSRATSQTIVGTTLEEVIFPGFARAGIDPAPAQSWARDAFARALG